MQPKKGNKKTSRKLLYYSAQIENTFRISFLIRRPMKRLQWDWRMFIERCEVMYSYTFDQTSMFFFLDCRFSLPHNRGETETVHGYLTHIERRQNIQEQWHSIRANAHMIVSRMNRNFLSFSKRWTVRCSWRRLNYELLSIYYFPSINDNWFSCAHVHSLCFSPH